MGEQRVSEMKWMLDHRAERAMNAYYYAFHRTRNETIDRILAEVAWAGKAYHNTSQWIDKDEDGQSVVDRIQAAASEAVSILSDARRERDEKTAEVERANARTLFLLVEGIDEFWVKSQIVPHLVSEIADATDQDHLDAVDIAMKLATDGGT